MAAYAPGAVSADEASSVLTNEYTVAAAGDATTTTLFSGVLDNYSTVSYKVEKKTVDDDEGNSTDSYILTISPKTASTVYTVPNELIYELAYSRVNTATTDDDDFDSVSEAAETIDEINVVGAAQISNGAFNIENGVDENDTVANSSLSDVKFNIDCQATYEATANTSTFTDIEFTTGTDALATSIIGVTQSNAIITHTMQPNTAKKNHQCLYGDKVDTSFTAHDFTKAGGATVGNGVHVCLCGKSSEDYKTDMGYTYNVHTWDDTKHVCSDCGADKFFAHTAAYEKVDSTTHAKTCEDCGKTLSAAEEHTYSITMGTDADNNACTACGAVHASTEHVYEYAWITNEDGIAELTKVGTTNGLVCACGKIKDHSVHNYVKANGRHICACGDEETNHNYSQKYNENGQLVAVSTGGVICQDCGKVDPDHDSYHQSDTDATFYDTTTHKHYCFCGEEVDNVNHTAQIDTDSHKHVCEFCDLDLSSDETDGHKYTKVYVTYEYTPEATDSETDASDAAKVAKRDSTLKTEPADPSINGFKDGEGGNTTYDDGEETYETAYVCECGAIKEHVHVYDYGVNQEHYCGCGAKEATPTHKYVTVVASNNQEYQQCSICGSLKNHTHTFDYDTDCTCTNPLCNATDHDVKVVGTKHICQNCGQEVTVHSFDVIDTENHLHKCACGEVSTVPSIGGTPYDNKGVTISSYGHTFVNHVCACGATAHKVSTTTKTVDGVKVHYCTEKLEDGETDCGYIYTADEDYGHVYDHVTNERCDLCGQVDPDHVHVPKTVNGSGASETCRCGAEIAHEWGLASSSYDTNHQCVNYEYTAALDANGKLVLTKTSNRCSKTAAHVFETTAADGSKVTLNFCECGAMNPKVLLDAGVIKNTADAGETPVYAEAIVIDDLATKYKTAYIVELAKAYDTALSYSIKTETNADDIVLAADEKSQATALAAVENFKTVWAKAVDNQAASSAEIKFVLEKDETGATTVDHSKRGYAVFANGEVNTYGCVYGKVGETVTIQVKPYAGYTFVGWYSTETPSATDTPLSTSAAMEVTIKDGHYPYYAKFKENAPQTISFGEGIKYYSSIKVPRITDESSSTVNDSWTNGTQGFPATLSFLTNEEVVIMADTTRFAGKGITGIKDKYGNIVEENVYVNPITGEIDTTSSNTNNAYKFNVAYDNSFTVATYTNTGLSGTSTYVQFKVGGKILAAQLLPTRDVTSIAPADPEKTGFTFKGWVYEGETTVQKLKTVTKAVGVLVPLFEEITDLKVTVTNGIIDSSTVKEAYTYGDQILVTADLQNAAGKYFSGWYDEDGNLVSKYRTAKINITKSMVLTAKYTRDTELVLEAGVDLVANRTTSALELTATRLLTDDMTLVEIGMLYKVGEVAESDMVITNEQLGRKYKSDAEKKNGDYVVTLNLSSEAAKTSVISARSYFIYQDAEGVNHTVYSNTVYSDPVQ
ncbi:MAG: InlB B-repeat-containing protein [Porcipelethomonas sp.]